MSAHYAIELPDWTVANPVLFRRLAARVDHFERSELLPRYQVPRCVHGCNPFTDSCAPCEVEEA